jgi:heptosyltransferase-1
MPENRTIKILIVRVGRAGDMVMCTPALSALLDHYPDAPRIQNFWVYDRKHSFPFFVYRRINRAIVSARFHNIYCFESNEKYYRLFKGSSASIYRLRAGKKVTHYAQLLLDMVSRGVKKNVGFYPLYLPVDDMAVKENDRLLIRRGITKNTLLIAFHPTFSGINHRRQMRKHGRHKIWPPASYAKLADRLHHYARQKNLELRVVMNLLPEETKFGETIAAQSLEGIDIICPEPNFMRYTAFLQRVDLLISPDTGPMHLAAALGTPLIALFSGKDPNDCGPFGRNQKFKVLRAEDMDFPLPGLAAISVESVFQACKAQICLITEDRKSKVPVRQ